MKYTFVAGIHGNEIMPVIALTSLQKKFIVGNQKALVENKRFVDHDLNKSFGCNGKGYEFARARQLLLEIPPNSVIVDFHTFPGESEPFAIVVDPKMIPLAIKTGLKRIVYMKFNIKEGHALINHRSGISVEVGNHTDFQSVKTTIKIYKNFYKKPKKIKRVKIFTVFDVISKPGNYKNFSLHAEGFYPVLARGNSYKFIGLKAKKEIYNIWHY